MRKWQSEKKMDCQSTVTSIRNWDSYIAKYPTTDQKSAGIELLITQAISYMFHLPFFTSVTDDATIKQKVVWNGKGDAAPVLAHGNGADANVFARHYDILLEVTQRTTANQWKFEFATSLRHLEDYVKKSPRSPDDIYLYLIAPEITKDTYNSVQQRVSDGDNILLLTFDELAKLVEVCHLTIGLRHIDLANLMEILSRFIIDNDYETYKIKHSQVLSEWRANFLKNDRLVFLGIKGYKVFMEKKLPMMMASDILTELLTLDEVKLYFNIVGQMPARKDVSNGMLTFGFAYESGLPRRDPFLSVASQSDIIKAINHIKHSLLQRRLT
jgi:hypothetical protein